MGFGNGLVPWLTPISTIWCHNNFQAKHTLSALYRVASNFHSWNIVASTKWHVAEDILKYIFSKEDYNILIKILLEFVPKGPIDN